MLKRSLFFELQVHYNQSSLVVCVEFIHIHQLNSNKANGIHTRYITLILTKMPKFKSFRKKNNIQGV